MPQPTAPRPTPAAERESPEVEPSATQKAADLTVNKVLAGAGAAATSAVLGSFFGATGTVFGAALGSVASTVATVVYQRSLDRTRDTLVARVRVPRRRQQTEVSDAPTVRLEVPRPRESPEAATTQLRVEPALRRPRRIWLWAGATVLVFVLGLLVVTGLEWAKGSTLTTGQSGTSVGRVIAPPPATADDGSGEDQGTTGTGSAEPTDDPDQDATGTGATGTDDPDRDDRSTAAPTPSAPPSEQPTRTPAPDSGAEPSAPAREGDRGDTDGDAVRTPEVPAPDAPPNR